MKWHIFLPSSHRKQRIGLLQSDWVSFFYFFEFILCFKRKSLNYLVQIASYYNSVPFRFGIHLGTYADCWPKQVLCAGSYCCAYFYSSIICAYSIAYVRQTF